MKYEIYEKTEISEITYEFIPEDFKFGKSWKHQTGKIDLKDLSASKFNPLISEIPKSKMEELNQKGETVFTIVTTQTIVIKNKKEGV